MSDKENRRKCVKCVKSPLMNNIKLFRFPNPAIRNLYKCTMWAKLIYPSEDQYACINFQRKLHNEHRMLCQNHFADEDFTDVSKKKLLRDAVPLEAQEEAVMVRAYFENSQNACSQILSIHNHKQGPLIMSSQIKIGSENRMPLKETGNKLQQCPPIVQCNKLKTHEDMRIFAKCTEYLKTLVSCGNKKTKGSHEIELRKIEEVVKKTDDA